MKHMLKKIIFLCLVALGNMFFAPVLQAMEAAGEAVIGEAARGAFEEGAVEGLEEGAYLAAGKQIAQEMGVSIEEIGALPEDAKTAFKEQLTKAFKEGGFENFFKEGKFEPGTNFKENIGKFQSEFQTQLKQLGEQKGFSPKEYQAVQKFDKSIESLEKFPVFTKEELRVAELKKITGFTPEVKPLSEAENNLNNALKEFESAERDLNYLQQIDASEQEISEATQNVEAKRKIVGEAGDKFTQELTDKIKNQNNQLSNARATVKKNLTAENLEQKQKIEEEFNDSNADAKKEALQDSLTNYQDAQTNKWGTADQNKKVSEVYKNLKDARTELKTAQENLTKNPTNADLDQQVKTAQTKVNDLQEEYKQASRGAGTAKRVTAEKMEIEDLQKKYGVSKPEDFDVQIKQKEDAITKAETTKTQAETKQKEAFDKLNEADKEFKENPQSKEAAEKYQSAQEEFQKAQKAFNDADTNLKQLNEEKTTLQTSKQELTDAQVKLKTAQAENRLADETISKAEKELYDSGQGDWKFNSGQRIKNTAESLKEQLVTGIVGGFAFSLPNYVIGPIEAAMGEQANRQTIEKPQLFGHVWMQIPRKLISPKGQPVVAKYLYVAVPNAKSNDQSITRSNQGDTETYLAQAPLYMSRTEYDEYATVPLTDPSFPGNMVHLNTGFQFQGDGTPDPTLPRIQFLTKPNEKLKYKSLQEILDEQAVDVRRGVAKKIYYEFRNQPVKYEGSPTLADRFVAVKNEEMKKQYPAEFPKDGYGGWGSVLNESINAFANGTNFGSFKIQGFTPLSQKAQKVVGMTTGLAAKPLPAYGVYLYQTGDTPSVKAVRAQKSSEISDVASEIVEYVVMKSENDIVPLQLPDAADNPYGIATYQLNQYLNTKNGYMVSLLNGAIYDETGKNIGVDENYKNYSDNFSQQKTQIDAMHKFIQEKSQYGPFLIGGKNLEPNPDLINAGIYVYKIAGVLEGGADDYVVATQGFNIIEVTSGPQFIISLVTSRIYDGQLLPYDNVHSKYPLSGYVVYKQAEQGLPPLVVAGKANTKYGTPITTGLQAPLYSLFMDSDINPNKVDAQAIQNEDDRKWYAQKVGVKESDAPYPLAIPDQWALGDRGPIVDTKTGQRIGQLIDEKKTEVPAANQLRKAIEASYNAWKKLSPKAVSEDLGPFVFAQTEPRPIVLNAESAPAIRDKNFVYTSANYPDAYLVLSDKQDGSGEVAEQFNIGQPQQYAIDLLTGSVYDAKKQGQLVSHIPADRMQTIRAKLSKSFQDKIAPLVTQKQKQDQYSIDTFFGPFKLYIDQKDLDARQFVYANMTPFGDPFQMDPKALQDALNKADYFIAISLKDPKGNADDPSNWIYGTKLGANTVRVLSLVTGILYTRGGGFAGYEKEFASSLSQNIDIQQGFLNTIWPLLEATWGKPMRDDLKQRIINLTQAEYNKLLQEKAAIEKAQDDEQKLFEPLDKNLQANLNAAPYVSLLQSFEPKRFVKKYNNKYYMVPPADPSGQQMYIDYNVGDPGKDNGVGMSYDADGNALVRMTGFVLENARAFAGVVVDANGKQSIDVAVDHPSIPMATMVKLDEKALETKLNQARAAVSTANTTYENALKQAKDKPVDTKITDALTNALVALNYAQQEHNAAQVAAEIVKSLPAGSAFYFNEKAGTYFVALPDAGGLRYIDLKAGYEFNSDGSPRLHKTDVLVNKTNKNEYLLISEGAYGLPVAVFKLPLVTVRVDGKTVTEEDLINKLLDFAITSASKVDYTKDDSDLIFRTSPDKLDAIKKALAAANIKVLSTVSKYNTWTINDEQKQAIEGGYNYNYYLANQDGDTANVFYFPNDKRYEVYISPKDAATTDLQKLGTYQADATKKFSLLRYFRTQGADGGSFVPADDSMLEPVLIIWDGKPDLNLQQVYYNNSLINLTGKGDTFTGQFQDENGKTRNITLKKVIKDYGTDAEGKIQAHYLSIIDGSKTYDMVYETSILDPQLPTSCEAIPDLLKQKEELQKLNYWKQCTWNVNVVSDSNGTPRLARGMSVGDLRNPSMTDALTKQADKRAAIVQQNLSTIYYDANNRFFYKLSDGRDKDWAYYQPKWDGWYVDLATGILYAPSLGKEAAFYPLGSLMKSQLYLLLDRLEISIGSTKTSDGEEKPTIVYRGSSGTTNNEINDLAKKAQQQQAVK
jgi:hypothetical protein